MDCAPPASLGGTYGGNPIACAASLAVMDVMQEENIPEKATKVGEYISSRLNDMAKDYSFIGDVRNLGALVALELFEDGDTNKPAADKTASLQAKAREKGLILLSCGVNGNVIRFLPPLTIEKEILDEGLDIIANALKEIS